MGPRTVSPDPPIALPLHLVLDSEHLGSYPKAGECGSEYKRAKFSCSLVVDVLWITILNPDPDPQGFLSSLDL